nr:hypothetical protein [Tanacetum cinerariifolium]
MSPPPLLPSQSTAATLHATTIYTTFIFFFEFGFMVNNHKGVFVRRRQQQGGDPIFLGCCTAAIRACLFCGGQQHNKRGFVWSGQQQGGFRLLFAATSQKGYLFMGLTAPKGCLFRGTAAPNMPPSATSRPSPTTTAVAARKLFRQTPKTLLPPGSTRSTTPLAATTFVSMPHPPLPSPSTHRRRQPQQAPHHHSLHLQPSTNTSPSPTPQQHHHHHHRLVTATISTTSPSPPSHHQQGVLVFLLTTQKGVWLWNALKVRLDEHETCKGTFGIVDSHQGHRELHNGLIYTLDIIHHTTRHHAPPPPPKPPPRLPPPPKRPPQIHRHCHCHPRSTISTDATPSPSPPSHLLHPYHHPVVVVYQQDYKGVRLVISNSNHWVRLVFALFSSAVVGAFGVVSAARGASGFGYNTI